MVATNLIAVSVGNTAGGVIIDVATASSALFLAPWHSSQPASQWLDAATLYLQPARAGNEGCITRRLRLSAHNGRGADAQITGGRHRSVEHHSEPIRARR